MLIKTSTSKWPMSKHETKKDFFYAFNKLDNDKDRWKLVFENSHLPFEVMIDNDEIFIPTEEEGLVLDFNEFSYDAVYEILTALNINADYV
jgi:hypothetical protein